MCNMQGSSNAIHLYKVVDEPAVSSQARRVYSPACRMKPETLQNSTVNLYRGIHLLWILDYEVKELTVSSS